MMEYRGYRAELSFDDDAGVFYGEVVETPDLITSSGASVAELRRAFHDSVGDYLQVSAERGRTPDRPFSGKISLRVAPQVDRAAVGSVC